MYDEESCIRDEEEIEDFNEADDDQFVHNQPAPPTHKYHQANTAANLPFYSLPSHMAVKAPAHIIHETRQWLNEVETKRPFTPRVESRHLFNRYHQQQSSSTITSSSIVSGVGAGGGGTVGESRPSSAISVGAQHFEPGHDVGQLVVIPTGSMALPPPKLEPISGANPLMNTQEKRNSNSAGSGSGKKSKRGSGLPESRSDSGEASSTGGSRAGGRGGDDPLVMSGSTTRHQFPQVQKISGNLPIASNESLLHKTLSTSRSVGGGNVGALMRHVQQSRELQRLQQQQQHQQQHELDQHQLHSQASNASNENTAFMATNKLGELYSQSQQVMSEDDQNAFYQTTLAAIIDLLSVPAHTSGSGGDGADIAGASAVMTPAATSNQDLIQLTTLLYDELEKANLLGKRSMHRTEICKVLFRLLDTQDSRLIMCVGRLALALNVKGNNLTNICKLIFKVSKNKHNDHLFLEYKMPNLLLRQLENCDPMLQNEALVYLTCTIKFLTASALGSNYANKSQLTEKESKDEEKIRVEQEILKQFSLGGTVTLLGKLQLNCVQLNQKIMTTSPVDTAAEDQNSSVSLSGASTSSTVATGNTTFSHFLVQTLGCLRNLESSQNISWLMESAGANRQDEFIQSQILHSTLDIFCQYPNDVEIAFEASRLLSHLSQSRACCQVLETHQNVDRFIQQSLTTLKKFYTRDDLVLRLAFIQGNLLLRSDFCRMTMFQSSQQGLPSFINVLGYYVRKLVTSCAGSLTTAITTGNTGAQNSKTSISSATPTTNNINKTRMDLFNKLEEIIVKMTRVLANGAMCESVGLLMARERRCTDLLTQILSILTSTPTNKGVGTSNAPNDSPPFDAITSAAAESSSFISVNSPSASTVRKHLENNEELLTSCISALNNISFYMTRDVCGPAHQLDLRYRQIGECMLHILMHEEEDDKEDENSLLALNMDVIKGVVRVLSNLSREPSLRDWLVKYQLQHFLNTFLDSDRHEIVYFSVGVILNLMNDVEKRPLLLENHTIQKLLEVLRDFAARDWQLAGLVCKTLCNYTDSMQMTSEAMMGSERDAREAIELLTVFTDSEEVQKIHQETVQDVAELEAMEKSWSEEFLEPARILLGRLESHANQFEPLVLSSRD